jgi:hypothetical protein
MHWEDFRLTKVDLFHLSNPLGGFLLGLKQLLHGHGLVEMVLGRGDVRRR